MKRTSILHILATLLLALLPASAAMASDYADEINGKAAPAGQRIIYEMNVGSFTQEGTLAAAQQRLQELKLTGVDIIWLMPVYPRGGGINSPYAATDFKKVNPSYGTVDDLRDFVDAAHALHMEVWLDWVPNHTATDAAWVTSHPEYYTKSGGKMVHPNNYGDVYQLDYGNSALVDAMNDCLKYWIDAAGIDGYRCDYVSSSAIPVSYWQQAIPMLKSYKAGKTITMLGEADFTDQTRLEAAGFDYDYAWGFQSKLVGFGTNEYANPLRTYCNSLLEASKGKGYSRMLYLTNHDQNYNEQKKTLTEKYGQNKYLLTVLTYTLCGMPLLYNGEETGGDQALNYFQDTKIDWTQTDAKMRNTLRVLAALRHSQPALADGTGSAQPEMLATGNDSRVLAYSRTSGSSRVIVLLNPSATEQDVAINGISGQYSLWLNSATIATSTGRTAVTFDGTMAVKVPARGYLVYVAGDESDDSGTTPQQGYTVYVDNQTGWDNLYLYMWGDVNDLGGGWPGMQPTGTKVVDGITYTCFTIDAGSTGKKENLIFNNGNGTQLPDYAWIIDHDVYLTITPTAVTEKGSTVKTIKFYVEDTSGWENLYVYAWNGDGKAEICGGWPGMRLSATEVVNGRTFKVAEFPASSFPYNFILNDNSGNQADAISGRAVDKDIYCTFDGTTATDITDTVTAVSLPSARRHGAAVYDLCGRRLAGTHHLPGIYIRGGKKIVLR